MELLVHLNKRIKSRPKIQLPVETLLVQYQDPAAVSFVTVSVLLEYFWLRVSFLSWHLVDVISIWASLELYLRLILNETGDVFLQMTHSFSPEVVGAG